MSGSTFVPSRPVTCAASRAARELGLRRGEFALAVHLGCIRTVPDEGGGGGRRVERAELDRLRAQDGFPETLRARVRVVGTAEGAALMDIPAGRFTRLARLGLLVPVRFYLNRYRAVVWLYLAEELRQFAVGAENAHLLKGRTPENLRGQLAAGVDLRARNWRGRHLGFLLREAEDPWARAGTVAAFLAPVEVADIVKDPYERAHLNRFRPAAPDHAAPGSPTAHLAEQLMTAHDSDEADWLRSELAHAVQEARGHSPAPRPAARHTAPARRPAAHHAHPVTPTVARHAVAAAQPASPPPPRGHETEPGATRPTRGLRAWLHRRKPRPAGV
ncbi:hypothetical protein AQI88_28065 [Streptomyces cellostaticus]|uniref:Uncharacterized protein n=1 Tax=Streptomyces cellostaticus TaxID=67285 RepID=A0A101NHE2_9ACTN|nr:DUF6397 family protein [Streptomyces cellostaticus]KUM93234.1 hypothetical protein AQI88_28065 [Streptomyces cellostaticus]GHI09512.1 hypothetical protein Scel_78330 [Streptomyces cellostaticus]